MFMSSSDYKESLRRYKPRVYVDGQRVDCVADEPALRPASTRSASATTSRCATSWRR